VSRKRKAQSNAAKALKLLLEGADESVRTAEKMLFEAEMSVEQCRRFVDNAKNRRYLLRQFIAPQNEGGGGKPQEIVQPAPRLRLRVVA
jgi:hypothetical protein